MNDGSPIASTLQGESHHDDERPVVVCLAQRSAGRERRERAGARTARSRVHAAECEGGCCSSEGHTWRRRIGFPLLTEGKLHNGCASPAQVDTVGIALRVSDWSTEGATAAVTDLGGPGETWRYSHKLPGGGFVAVGVGERAWIEASLPKRVGDGNIEGLPVADVLPALESALDEARTFCEPIQGLAEAAVVRLDVVRDFDGVRHVGSLLDGLSGVPRGKREKVRRWSDGQRNRAETLRVGPRAWGGTLYDKHVETGGVAPEGRLRFEGRLHADQLTGAWAFGLGAVVRQVADLGQENVERLRRATFERCSFERQVTAVATIAELVFSGEGLKPQEQAALWAYLTAPGYAARLHRNSERKYRRMARSLGVTPGIDLAEVEDRYSVQLDYDAGTELLRAS